MAKVIYLDESGTDAQSPFLTVAAVIIDPDSQYENIETDLRTIKYKFLSEEKQSSFVVHATDLFSGKKKKLPSELHEEERRWWVLENTLRIPKKFNLPVCVSSIDKEKFQQTHADTEKDSLRVAMHASAIVLATLSVESWLKANTSELGFVTAEKNDEVQKAAKAAHLFMKQPDALRRLGIPFDSLRLVRIKDEIQFGTKVGCPMLQLADVTAWAYRQQLVSQLLFSRGLPGAERADRFIEAAADTFYEFSHTRRDASGRLYP